MAMAVNFTNPRPQMVQEDPYSVQPQPMDSGLASPLAQALAAQQSQARGYTDPSPYGGSAPQMSMPSYNAANPWGGGQMATGDMGLNDFNARTGRTPLPSPDFSGLMGGQGQQGGFSTFLPNGNMTGTMPGNSGMAPRGYQTKPMQSPILGPMNQQQPAYMPPNFRRRMFGHQGGMGGGGIGGGGSGLNLTGGFSYNPLPQSNV